MIFFLLLISFVIFWQQLNAGSIQLTNIKTQKKT
jgi:hypothetical protein